MNDFIHAPDAQQLSVEQLFVYASQFLRDTLVLINNNSSCSPVAITARGLSSWCFCFGGGLYVASMLIIIMLNYTIRFFASTLWQSAHFHLSVALLLSWTVLVLIGDKVVPLLSIRHSISQLLGTTDDPQRQNRLSMLDIFRVVAIVWVVSNHLGSEGRVDILDRLPSGENFKEAIHSNMIFGPLLGNSALGVEIFLVLSGLLAARSWMRHASAPFHRHYVAFMVRRWLRLAPIVAVFVFFATGPLMKQALPKFHSTMVETCGAHGVLSHLTFTSNWASTPTCLGYLWYLGLDMQLYLVAPLILHLLACRPRMGVALCVFLMSASAVFRAVYCRAYGVCNKSDVDIPFISFPGQDLSALKKVYAGLWDMYGRPHTTCGPFLIGILIGYASTLDIPLWLSVEQARRLFRVALAAAVAIIYGILPEYWNPDQGDTAYNTAYTALFRTLFAGAVAMMIASMYYASGKRNVAWMWSVAAKLTFNVYLLHMPIVYLFNFVGAYQQASGVLGLLLALPFAIVLSFFGALLFYCFVEAPLTRVCNHVFGPVLQL